MACSQLAVVFNYGERKSECSMNRFLSIFLAVSLIGVTGVFLFQGMPADAASSREGNSIETASTVAGIQTANAVCPDPTKPCHNKNKHFDDWELSFKMPNRLAANKTYRSSSFYALILKTFGEVEDCDGGEFLIAGEAERKKLQRTQPNRKVFASYECPNMGAVDYDFAGRYDAKREKVVIFNFLAIYAGTTKADADALLAELKPKYPKAVIKQMTVGFEVMDQ